MSTKKRAAFVKYANFTNEEVIEIAKKFREEHPLDKKKKDDSDDTKSWLSFDIKSETQNEVMKKRKVRYLKPMITDLSGKTRPARIKAIPDLIRSKVTLGETDSGLPGSAGFSTRVLTRDETKLASMADDIVNEKFPTISDDEFEAKSKQQEDMLRKQFAQWQAEILINDEFERLWNIKAVQREMKYVPSKGHTIGGNVQYGYKPKEGNEEDEKLVDPETGLIPLDQPLVRKKIKIDTKSGELWCKIYDTTLPTTGGKKKFAAAKNPKTKQMAPLNVYTVCGWLRPMSAYTGVREYKVCISSSGVRLHEYMKEMCVRRAAKMEAESQTDAEDVDALSNFGGNFANGDDVDDEDGEDGERKEGSDDDGSNSEPNKKDSNKKTTTKAKKNRDEDADEDDADDGATGMEKQLAKMRRATASD